MATSTIKQVTNNSGTGYCKMPDGTLIQWGSGNNAKSGDVISYPFEFATDSNIRIYIQPSYNTYTTIQCNFIHGHVQKGNFTVYAYNTETKALSTSTTLQFDWLAIGRWK